ncbi:hypothetical protein D9M71_524400 [compost metagenome]
MLFTTGVGTHPGHRCQPCLGVEPLEQDALREVGDVGFLHDQLGARCSDLVADVHDEQRTGRAQVLEEHRVAIDHCDEPEADEDQQQGEADGCPGHERERSPEAMIGTGGDDHHVHRARGDGHAQGEHAHCE